MNSFSIVRAVLLSGFVSASLAVAASKKDKELDILISADASPASEGFRPASGIPVLYLLTQNRMTLGDGIAGVKLPPPKVVEKAVVAELAKQGFERTDVGGKPPKILIMATFGDANFEQPPTPPPSVDPMSDPDLAPYLLRVNLRQIVAELGNPRLLPTTIPELFPPDNESTPIPGSMLSAISDPKPASGPIVSGFVNSESLIFAYPSTSRDISQLRDLAIAEAIRIRERTGHRGQDREKILALIGAPKLERAFATQQIGQPTAERIALASSANHYYVQLSAFDASRSESGQRTILWRTSMLIDWREDFSKSISEMLAQAGPLFGTDAPMPGYVNTKQSPAGRVEIGETKVVPNNAAPVGQDAKK